MKRCLIVSVALAILLVTQCCAQKSTIDPNAKKPAAEVSPGETSLLYNPAKDPDKRMAQKISYQASHARLNTVMVELIQATGVPLFCGKSRNDWAVRDIPVTIYAKDLPLGTLLRGIARATHNIVRAEKLNDQVVYRIMQDPKLTRQFTDYDSAKESFRKAVISWNWDCVAGLGQESQLQHYESNPVIRSLRVDSIRKVAALLAALGPDYKQRVLDGEAVMLEPGKVPPALKPVVMDVLRSYDQLRIAYRSQYARNPNASTPENLMPFTSDELEKSSLTLSQQDSESLSLWNSMVITAAGPIGLGLPTSAYDFLKQDKNGKRPGPAPPTAPKVTDDSPYEQQFVDFNTRKHEILKKAVDMDDWAQRKGPTCGEVWAEMAKRGGFSLVMEDWDYHRDNPYPTARWLKKGVTLEEMARHPYRFTIDADDKLVVPLANDWVAKHEALAPASVIDPLVDKLKNDIVRLDDLLPAMLLTKAQWNEWVQQSKDLSIINRHTQQSQDPLWQFFAMLTVPDQEQAAKQEGLSMARFDPSVVSDLLARYHKARSKLAYVSYLPKYPTISDEQLSRLVLRLKSSESPFSSQFGITSPLPKIRVIPEGLDRTYSYSLSLSVPDGDSETRYAEASGPWQLPFYSKEREAEEIKHVIGDTKPAPAATPPTGALIKL